MPAKAKGRGPQNRKQVSINDPNELRAWAQYYGKSAVAVIQAVVQVGSQPDAVAAQLGV